MNKIFTMTETNEVLQFKCQQQWRHLKADVVIEKTWYGRSYYKEVNKKQRYCVNCNKYVYLCKSENEIYENAAKGNCVALDTEIARKDKKKSQEALIHDSYDIKSLIISGTPRRLFNLFFCRNDGLKESVCETFNELYWMDFIINKPTIDSIKKLIFKEEQASTCKTQKEQYALKKLLILSNEANKNNIDWHIEITKL